MHSSQLFVPPTLLERRRVTLSPDFLSGWQLLGWAGAGLIAAGAADLLVSGMPTSVGVGLAVAAGRAHVLVLGIALGLSSAVALGRRSITRALATAAVGLGAVLAILALVFVLGPSIGEVVGDTGAAFTRGRARAFLMSGAYAGTLLLMGASAWRHALRHEHVQL